MVNLQFSRDDFFSERDVVYAERKQTTDVDAHARFRETLSAMLYNGHPYANPIVGWPLEILALQPDQVMDFYRHHYAPNNAIMIISGAVKAPDVFKLADEIYGPIASRSVPDRPVKAFPQYHGRAAITHTDAQVHNPLYIKRMVFEDPVGSSRDHALALSVVEDMVGGSAGPLYQEIVVRQKLATHVSVGVSTFMRDYGEVVISAIPADGVDLKALEKAVLKALDDIRQTGLSEERLATSLRRLQDRADFARDSLTGPAMTIGRLRVLGYELEAIEYWPKRLEEVTVEDVRVAAGAYFHQKDESCAYGIKGYLHPAGGHE